MFRITRDPSPGSIIQCLVKITVMVLSCLCQRTRWNHYCNFSQALCKAPWWWIPCDPKHVGAFSNIL